jgi:hypothetical protein
MPNWCENFVRFQHTNDAEIYKLKMAYDTNTLCETFYPWAVVERDFEEQAKALAPLPMNLHLAQLSLKVGWGTKWDTGRGSGREPIIVRNSDGLLTMYAAFDTAWVPPLGVFTKMVQQGFDVQCYYHEAGVRLFGTWVNGVRTDTDDNDQLSQVRQLLPADVIQQLKVDECLIQRDAELAAMCDEGDDSVDE